MRPAHKERKNFIDFGSNRSRSKVTVTKNINSVSGIITQEGIMQSTPIWVYGLPIRKGRTLLILGHVGQSQ